MLSDLLQKGSNVSIKNVKRRLSKAFGLKGFKPAKKMPYFSYETEENTVCTTTR